MLDVKAVSGFPGKLFPIGEAALNGLPPDQAASDHQTIVAALDRLETALARIAAVERDLLRREQDLWQRESELGAGPAAVNGEQPVWAKDVAVRLDGLIGDLRRALSGEQI